VNNGKTPRKPNDETFKPSIFELSLQSGEATPSHRQSQLIKSGSEYEVSG
jgi:hypothetical protein